MRKGINPVKQLQTVEKPQRVTAAVLNHIPFLDGFYADMLKVLDLSLTSLRENAGMDFDLLVYDNGSCAEARDYLLTEFDKGVIQTLILSDRNMGKGGAWNVMLQAAPGEIVAYADNDVLYHAGWLRESVKVLDTYPNVGMVTSRPYHSIPDLYSASLEWAQGKPEVKVETGRLINPEWMREFLLSLGRTEEEMLEDISQNDVRLTYRGVSTYCGASHWQFLAWKKVLQEFLPIDLSKPLGQVLQLDKMVNERGYLRLMTDQPYVMNLSNSIELPDAAAKAPEPQLRKRLWDFPLVKSPLMRIYHAIFRLYYDR
ncbi:MAG: glycosyltransferase family 2 protein [Anaerolineaceae bacterium]